MHIILTNVREHALKFCTRLLYDNYCLELACSAPISIIPDRCVRVLCVCVHIYTAQVISLFLEVGIQLLTQGAAGLVLHFSIVLSHCSYVFLLFLQHHLSSKTFLCPCPLQIAARDLGHRFRQRSLSTKNWTRATHSPGLLRPFLQ